jgi:hypothetical protein
VIGQLLQNGVPLDGSPCDAVYRSARWYGPFKFAFAMVWGTATTCEGDRTKGDGVGTGATDVAAELASFARPKCDAERIATMPTITPAITKATPI